MMRRWLHILLLLMLPLLSCTREQRFEPEQLQEDGAPDGYVTIRFACAMPADASTKALGEASNLSTLHLAVFGSNGYFKEYLEATLISSQTRYRRFYDFYNKPYYKEVDTYVYQANLKLSNSPRTIHFLGNGPGSIRTGLAEEVLPNILGEKETAFWQMISLPSITAKKGIDSEGNECYLNSDGQPRESGDDYMVSDETQAYFVSGEETVTLEDESTIVIQTGGIGLIRNWAKVILKNEPNSNFTPVSFAVVNVPKHGTVVPYGGKKGFISHYETLGFDELFNPDGVYAYNGNLPEGTPFNSTVPDLDAFTAYDPAYDEHSSSYNSNLDSDDDPAVYLYERPVPSEKTPPSYVLIYGRYKNLEDPAFTMDSNLTDDERENGVLCFYKVDFMSAGQYYPIFRNFKYQILIQKITSRGHKTAAEAALSAGSADVSADITASTLPDISDGTQRLAIRPWMSKTFYLPVSDPLTEQLYMVFYRDIEDLDPDTEKPIPYMGDGDIWFELTPDDDSVILGGKDGITIGEPAGKGYDMKDYPLDDYGWRPIMFGISEPDQNVARTQTLRIYCKAKKGTPQEEDINPLYRDIVITLQPKQTMIVKCLHPRVIRAIGREQVVNVSIPDGLVESMFPLVFKIEPEKMTLTPDNSKGINMPVVAGKSIADPSKSTFYFERTLTWEEYDGLRTTVNLEDESRWRTFSSYFKTNCEHNHTAIWVDNEYFSPDSDSFTDYRSFGTCRFTTPVYQSGSKQILVQLGVDKESDGSYNTVVATLKGLVPAFAAGGEDNTYKDGVYDSATQTWSFMPQADNLTLPFYSSGSDGVVSITFNGEGDDYEPVTLKPWYFSNVGFIDAHIMMNNASKSSNVAFGKVNQDNGKTVLFGYCVDPDNPTPTVLREESTTNISGSSSINLAKETHATDYTGEETFHWINMTTSGKTMDPVRFVLRAVGYVDEQVHADRFYGNIHTKNLAAADLKKFGAGEDREQQYQTTEQSVSCYYLLAFDQITSVSDAGITLESGKTYRISLDIYGKQNDASSATKCELMQVQINYARSSTGQPQKPSLAEPVGPDGSVYYQFLGNNAEYIWSFPRGHKSGTLELRAPSNRDIVIESIIIKAFYDRS